MATPTRKLARSAAKKVSSALRQSSRTAAAPDFDEVLTLIEDARRRAYQAVNTELVGLYWQLGEHISKKIASAEWGDGVVEDLAATIVSQTKRPEEREFYMLAAIKGGWSSRELERQLRTQAFRRRELGPGKVSAALTQTHPSALEDLKNAYNLEFLGLPDGHSEADLHGALLRNLGRFITELGRDFCFVGSEYPLQVGHQDFAIGRRPS